MKKNILILIFFLFTIITLASFGVAIYAYTQLQAKVKSSGILPTDSDQIMLRTIGSTMLLPSDKPTIVSITDKSKLQDQDFFKKAENGDKVVIFESTRRIILFRPSLNKIVDVAPLVFQPQTSPAVQQLPSTRRATSSGNIQSSSSSATQIGVEERGEFQL